MGDRRVREAENETIFRESNEWTMEDIAEGIEVDRTYICECSDIDCSAAIDLSLAEYEIVRAEPTRFAIAVNHQNPEIDRVVVENVRYATVEKIGALARIARDTDPRRRS